MHTETTAAVCRQLPDAELSITLLQGAKEAPFDRSTSQSKGP
jgi:hypothetical protein